MCPYIYSFSFVCLISAVLGDVRFVEGNGTLITEEKSSFFITCEIAESDLDNVYVRKDGNIVDGFTNTTSKSGNSTTVRLLKTSIEVSDAGIYTCSNGNMSASVTIQVVKENKFLKSYSFTEGQALDLICPVSSLYHSSVEWLKEGVPLMNNWIVTLNVGNTMDGRLQISSLQLEDRGHYTCTSTWNIGKKSYATLARVRGKLAPLWPVIGIIVEILVLALIILFCKDRRKKNS